MMNLIRESSFASTESDSKGFLTDAQCAGVAVFESLPAACCSDCLGTHRGDWEVRPNPHLVQEVTGPPCSFCGRGGAEHLLTLACPIDVLHSGRALSGAVVLA